jgi:hypothetical protein
VGQVEGMIQLVTKNTTKYINVKSVDSEQNSAQWLPLQGVESVDKIGFKRQTSSYSVLRWERPQLCQHLVKLFAKWEENMFINKALVRRVS